MLEAMKKVRIKQAKSRLASLIKEARPEEKVIIASDEISEVNLVPPAGELTGKRKHGSLKGKLIVKKKFFSPPVTRRARPMGMKFARYAVQR